MDRLEQTRGQSDGDTVLAARRVLQIDHLAGVTVCDGDASQRGFSSRSVSRSWRHWLCRRFRAERGADQGSDRNAFGRLRSRERLRRFQPCTGSRLDRRQDRFGSLGFGERQIVTLIVRDAHPCDPSRVVVSRDEHQLSQPNLVSQQACGSSEHGSSEIVDPLTAASGGVKFRLLGVETADGRPTYHLRSTYFGNERTDVWFSTDQDYLIRIPQPREPEKSSIASITTGSPHIGQPRPPRNSDTERLQAGLRFILTSFQKAMPFAT